MNPTHRLQVRREIEGVRALIELRLDVRTIARKEGDWWAIYFKAPNDANLDFLRPYTLPPIQVSNGNY